MNIEPKKGKRLQLVSVGYKGNLRVGFGGWSPGMSQGLLYLIHDEKLENRVISIDSSIVYINTKKQRDDCLETLNGVIKDLEGDIENLNNYLIQMDIMKVFLKRAEFKESKLESTSEISDYINKGYALFEFDRGHIYDCLIFGNFNKEKNTVSIFKERFVYNRYTALTRLTPDVVVINLPKTFKKYPVITTTDKKKTQEKLKKKREEIHKQIDDLKQSISLRESMKNMLLEYFEERVYYES
jgi:hypothetical protein